MAYLQPMNGYVIVERLDGESVSRGGIIIPDIAIERPTKGKVIASGPGTRLADGTFEPTGVKAGDTVLYGAYSGTDIEVNGERLLVLDVKNIYAVIVDQEVQDAQAA